MMPFLFIKHRNWLLKTIHTSSTSYGYLKNDKGYTSSNLRPKEYSKTYVQEINCKLINNTLPWNINSVTMYHLISFCNEHKLFKLAFFFCKRLKTVQMSYAIPVLKQLCKNVYKLDKKSIREPLLKRIRMLLFSIYAHEQLSIPHSFWNTFIAAIPLSKNFAEYSDDLYGFMITSKNNSIPISKVFSMLCEQKHPKAFPFYQSFKGQINISQFDIECLIRQSYERLDIYSMTEIYSDLTILDLPISYEAQELALQCCFHHQNVDLAISFVNQMTGCLKNSSQVRSTFIEICLFSDNSKYLLQLIHLLKREEKLHSLSNEQVEYMFHSLIIHNCLEDAFQLFSHMMPVYSTLLHMSDTFLEKAVIESNAISLNFLKRLNEMNCMNKVNCKYIFTLLSQPSTFNSTDLIFLYNLLKMNQHSMDQLLASILVSALNFIQVELALTVLADSFDKRVALGDKILKQVLEFDIQNQTDYFGHYYIKKCLQEKRSIPLTALNKYVVADKLSLRNIVAVYQYGMKHSQSSLPWISFIHKRMTVLCQHYKPVNLSSDYQLASRLLKIKNHIPPQLHEMSDSIDNFHNQIKLLVCESWKMIVATSNDESSLSQPNLNPLNVIQLWRLANEFGLDISSNTHVHVAKIGMESVYKKPFMKLFLTYVQLNSLSVIDIQDLLSISIQLNESQFTDSLITELIRRDKWTLSDWISWSKSIKPANTSWYHLLIPSKVFLEASTIQQNQWYSIGASLYLNINHYQSWKLYCKMTRPDISMLQQIIHRCISRQDISTLKQILRRYRNDRTIWKLIEEILVGLKETDNSFKLMAIIDSIKQRRMVSQRHVKNLE
ncbi:hypothetical protein BC833DRAFT_587264 [Globomyces pollinis-pini]|nr:hypothetical protein BC833DRAFT_587264 [Globomyces pollinis-pini]